MKTYPMMGHLYPEADAKIVPWIRDYQNLPEKQREMNRTLIDGSNEDTKR